MRVENTVVVEIKSMKRETIGLGQAMKTTETVDNSSAGVEVNSEYDRRGIADGPQNIAMAMQGSRPSLPEVETNKIERDKGSFVESSTHGGSLALDKSTCVAKGGRRTTQSKTMSLAKQVDSLKVHVSKT